MGVADFFCGAGGFSEGFSQEGFDVVFALDNWLPAIETHHLNHPNCDSKLINILELDTPQKIDEVVPDTEIIIGSPPCISFSNSNKSGKADKTKGLELIKAFLRIVAWKKKKGVLKYWVMENVPNSNKYTKNSYSWTELGLPGKGPELQIRIRDILNSADFGAPQIRKRFICGDFPAPKKIIDNKKYISIKNIFSSLGNPLEYKDKNITDPLYGVKIKSKYLTDHFYDTRVMNFEWQKAKRLKLDHGYMGKMSFPENIDNPSRTVMATMSASTRESLIFYSFNSNSNKNGYRVPTVREAACFMSFPITYQFEGGSEAVKYRLVGNAVCPKLSFALARAILKKENKIYGKRKSNDKIISKINLNGAKRKKKTIKNRKRDAIFDFHIPYLKIRNYRVSIDNRDSNFDKGIIKWKGVLHHGTGKDAKNIILNFSDARRLFYNAPGFRSFDRDLRKLAKELGLSHHKLQNDYILNSSSVGPYNLLAELKELIDNHYPERKDFEDLKHRKKGFSIGNGSMPLRIGAAIYSCSLIVSLMK